MNFMPFVFYFNIQKMLLLFMLFAIKLLAQVNIFKVANSSFSFYNLQFLTVKMLEVKNFNPQQTSPAISQLRNTRKIF